MTETLIQVVLLDSRLDMCPRKRLATSMELLLLVVESRLNCLLLDRLKDRSMRRGGSWLRELLHLEGREGGCYSWLGLREVGGARLLCRDRHQGRSRGP